MTMIASERQVTVTVRGKAREYASIRTAVLHHNILRDKSGKGASQWVPWIIDCEGQTYHISYNGRVWCGLPSAWLADTVEVLVDGVA